MTEAAKRVITALVAAPIAVALAYVGGWAFGALVVAIALAAQFELYAMAEATDAPANRPFGLTIGALLAGYALWPGGIDVVLLLLLGLIVASPFLFERAHLLSGLAVTVLGAVYPAGFIGFLALLREARGPAVENMEAFYLVLTTFLIVWATDIFAYYTGKILGKHPLSPTISPNKTWEGTFGGFGAACLVAAGCKVTMLSFLGWPHVLWLAVIGGGVSQLGDLAESQLKRASEVKDSSALMPGHGGVFDRFDAMVVAAPLIYFYLVYVAGVIG